MTISFDHFESRVIATPGYTGPRAEAKRDGQLVDLNVAAARYVREKRHTLYLDNIAYDADGEIEFEPTTEELQALCPDFEADLVATHDVFSRFVLSWPDGKDTQGVEIHEKRILDLIALFDDMRTMGEDVPDSWKSAEAMPGRYGPNFRLVLVAHLDEEGQRCFTCHAIDA